MNPKEAEIKIDGQLVEGNPYEGSFPKDDKMHNVEISAKGHQPDSIQVRFDGDHTLTHTLTALKETKTKKEKDIATAEKKAPTESRSRSSRSKKKRRSSSKSKKEKTETKTPDVTKPVRKKPRRKIDDEDPWS